MQRGLDSVASALRHVYFTDRHDVVAELYAPLLKVSVRYVRAAGYFRSSVFTLMTEELLDFAIRGGRIDIVTSVHVDRQDFEVVSDVVARRLVVESLAEMLAHPVLASPTRMLAALVQAGAITLHIAVRRSGIFHSKKGFFEDAEGRTVLFQGSGNETRSALHPDVDEGSAEEFSVYYDFGACPGWAEFGSALKAKLESELAGGTGGTKVFPITELDPAVLRLLEDEDRIDLELHRDGARERSSLVRGASDADQDFITLHKHQKEAIAAWARAGHRGILQHATGAGKTITALAAMRLHIAEGYPAVVLVPSAVLLQQWIAEIQEHLPSASVLAVGSGYNWGRDIDLWLDSTQIEGKQRVCVAILHSARGDRFQAALREPAKLMLVVDECHRVGAPSYTELTAIRPHRALGLSATPKRYGDPEGTDRLHALLGETVHTYSLEQALQDERLTPYFYEIREVRLTQAEAADYAARMDEIRAALRRARRDDDGRAIISEHLKLKIIQAKNVIKKAQNKAAVAAEIVAEAYVEGSLQHFLVYCQDGEQLAQVRSELNTRGFQTLSYWTGSEGDLEATLAHYTMNGGILLAINCFDEGVNIPAISHGVILASSQNPRQFIQRRGRLLRRSPGKLHARIWDALVVPAGTGGEEANFLLSEVKRAHEFASHANNHQARLELNRIVARHGLAAALDDSEDD